MFAGVRLPCGHEETQHQHTAANKQTPDEMCHLCMCLSTGIDCRDVLGCQIVHAHIGGDDMSISSGFAL